MTVPVTVRVQIAQVTVLPCSVEHDSDCGVVTMGDMDGNKVSKSQTDW